MRSPFDGKGLGSPFGRRRAGGGNWLGDTFGAGFARRNSDWQDAEGVTLVETTVTSITAALAYINTTVNATPAAHYRITVTTGGAEDTTPPQINRAIDIVGAGGSCVVVGSGSYRLHSRKMIVNGVRGVTFENFRFFEPIDRGALDPVGAAFTGQLLVGDQSGSPAEVYFYDCRFGAFGDDDLFGAALGAVGRVSQTSKVIVDRCMGRGFLTFWRVTNSATLHNGQSYFDGKTDDIVDMDAQGGNATYVADGLVEGLPYDRPISLLKIFGGAGESGTFEVGETVTQNGVARGTVVRVLGSGDINALDGITKSGTPVTGKVYIERTAQFIEGFAVVGAESDATSAVVGVGELDAYDGNDWLVGSPYAGLHSDFAQWGVSGENDASRYNVTIRNCVSAGSGASHASAQGTFAEYNSAGVGYTPHRVCIENSHFMPTGFWGLAITSPDGIYRNIASTWPPLGARQPNSLAEQVDSRREPTPFEAAGHGNLRFASIPDDFPASARMVFENIIAPGTDYQNATAETRWESRLSFDPADRVVIADVTAETGVTSYGTLFGSATYSTDMWVESGPNVPSDDTLFVAMARWLQWVRDNREPAVGWGASGWIDPVSFADVEAEIPASAIVPVELGAYRDSSVLQTSSKTITTTTAATGTHPVLVEVSFRYMGTANVLQDITATLNGTAMTVVDEEKSNSFQLVRLWAESADVPSGTFDVVIANATANFNGVAVRVTEMQNAANDQTGAAKAIYTSGGGSVPTATASITTTAADSYVMASSVSFNALTGITGEDTVFDGGTTNSGNTVTFGGFAGLVNETPGAVSVTFTQSPAQQFVAGALEILKA